VNRPPAVASMKVRRVSMRIIFAHSTAQEPAGRYGRDGTARGTDVLVLTADTTVF
jgi:hypothetical protein